MRLGTGGRVDLEINYWEYYFYVYMHSPCSQVVII